jgi:hypothetical protein
MTAGNRVGALERLDDGDAVEDGEVGHRLRRVEGQPGGDVAAAVVPDDGEPVVAQPPQRHHVAGHRPRGVRRVVRGRRRGARAAVAAQVGAHDRVPRVGEQRRHAVPGRLRARMAVQQHHRRSGPAAAQPHPDPVRDVDVLLRPAAEELSHPGILPSSDQGCR